MKIEYIKIEKDKNNYFRLEQNSGNYIEIYNLEVDIRLEIAKHLNTVTDPCKIKVDGKYIGRYGKCSNYHTVFNMSSKKGDILMYKNNLCDYPNSYSFQFGNIITHNWDATQESIPLHTYLKIKEDISE